MAILASIARNARPRATIYAIIRWEMVRHATARYARIIRMRSHTIPIIVGGISSCGMTIWQASVGMTRSEEHTSELQSLMRISYAVFCWKKKKQNKTNTQVY